MEAVPLFEKRSGYETEETGLDFGNRGSVAVAERCNRQAQSSFQVALAVEFFTDLQTPSTADFPWTAGIADVGTLERYLQHKVTVVSRSHIQRIII